MKNYIHICWCILYFTACHESSDKSDFLVIPVDVNQNYPVRLSEISEEIQKVELETSDDCLIKFIEKVLLVEDRIFVLDRQAGGIIQVFDYSGKFLFSINKRGQGPGEYLTILNISADEVNNHIYIASPNKIIRYASDNGNFIDECTRVRFPEYIRFENDLLHVFDYNPGIPNKNNTFLNTTVMFRFRRDWQMIDSVLIKSVELNAITGTLLPNIDFISQDNLNNLFVYYPVMLNEPIVRDTLYKLNESVLEPYIKLKFSDENNLKRNKHLLSISIVSNLLIAEYISKSDKVKKYFYFNFKNKTGKNMLNGFLDDICNTGFAEIRLLNNNHFYYVKEVKDLSEYKEEPNPTLYIGKFK